MSETKKKMRSYEPEILEAWATWECFRKLGFSSDDLYWVVENTANASPGPGLTLGIILRAQDKQFTVTCSKRLTKNRADRLFPRLQTFILDVKDGAFDHDEMRDVLHASFIWKNKVDFVTTLLSKGFVFPSTLN